MLESRIIIDNSMAISLLLGLAKRIMKKMHCATFDFLGGWLYIGVEDKGPTILLCTPK